ncbi:PilZ domain-containing protein [Novosphingobium sp. PY1]|uniref:Type IV pilus assembly PilZ n=1 Tax=Ochrobactrum sp. PW1 TaxID=1882222 RepID=A0A292GSZ1_9HYPH|nr:PilZ domain-containing protein [Novosphingobium sp. PY1]BBA74291.1 type IV pilus assembly PilZ [Ochrobactrum sp. PW1]GFM29140.1 type IV pilus assembly PilZ [Novosphingobium sp. PY1]
MGRSTTDEDRDDNDHDVSNSDRRDSDRTRTIYRLVQIEREGDEGLGRCRNISDGGMSLRLSMPVDLNDRLSIAFSPSVKLSGQVVWTNGDECGVKFDQPIDSSQILSSTSQEARAEGARAPRLKANVPGKVIFDDQVLQTVVLDLSQRGAKITQDGRFKRGLRVKILLDSGYERDGIVQWAKDNFAGIFLIDPFSVDDLGSIERLKLQSEAGNKDKKCS